VSGKIAFDSNLQSNLQKVTCIFLSAGLVSGCLQKGTLLYEKIAVVAIAGLV
jgi:hypothetical protein